MKFIRRFSSVLNCTGYLLYFITHCKIKVQRKLVTSLDNLSCIHVYFNNLTGFTGTKTSSGQNAGKTRKRICNGSETKTKLLCP